MAAQLVERFGRDTELQPPEIPDRERRQEGLGQHEMLQLVQFGHFGFQTVEIGAPWVRFQVSE